MDEQLRKFVAELSRRPHVSVRELSSLLNVSERTVRNYICRASEELVGTAVIENQRGRVGFTILDNDEFARRMSRRPAKGLIPETREERVVYLLRNLLSRSTYVTLEELSGELFISTRTLSDDLRDVERNLASMGLSLERRPRYGILVEGPELTRRVALGTLVGASSSEITWPDVRAIMNRVERCTRDTLNQSDIQISSVARHNLIVHIVIALMRMREGCFVPLDPKTRKAILDSPEYSTAKRLAEKIGDEFETLLPQDETVYIALHLAGRRTMSDVSGGAAPVISDEVWRVVETMLDTVLETFGIDLRGDLELRMNLARHVVPLAVRLSWHMRLDNPLLQDIKSRFPLAYSMGASTAPVLEKAYGSAPSDAEIGYLALAFALALERRETQLPKKNILVVCASGHGSARLLEHRYRKEFGDYLASIEVCDASRVDTCDFTHIDYVFTTVPLNVELPVPVRLVQFFPDQQELERVRDILRKGPMADIISACFRRDLFFAHLAATSKSEVIDFLTCEVMRTGLVDSSFAEQVLRREQAAPTSFGNSIAMPHPLEPVGDTTVVAVGLLEHPIAWDSYGHDVRVVFLVSFPRKPDDTSRALIDMLAEVFSDKDGIDRLICHQTWEDLASLVERRSL